MDSRLSDIWKQVGASLSSRNRMERERLEAEKIVTQRELEEFFTLYDMTPAERQNKRPWLNHRGITVVELCCTLVMFGCVMSMALPGITQFGNYQRLKNDAVLLHQTMYRARIMAVNTKKVHEVRIDLREGTYSLWRIQSSTSHADEKKIQEWELDSPWVYFASSTFEGRSPTLSFSDNGTCDQSGDVVLTDKKHGKKTIRVTGMTGFVRII